MARALSCHLRLNERSSAMRSVPTLHQPCLENTNGDLLENYRKYMVIYGCTYLNALKMDMNGPCFLDLS